VIAAAAETEAMPVGRGLALVAALGVCVASYATLAPRAAIANLVPLDKPPAAGRPRPANSFGFRVRGHARGYRTELQDSAGLPAMACRDRSDDNRWNPSNVAKGPALLFWYRTSPRELEPDSPSD
jgi:hypothetical protein